MVITLKDNLTDKFDLMLIYFVWNWLIHVVGTFSMADVMRPGFYYFPDTSSQLDSLSVLG